MLPNLKPAYFFNLSLYEHAKLFENSTYVWEALANIGLYLQSSQLGLIETDVPQGTFLIDKNTIHIGKGTIIEPGAYIKGPCIIGQNCTIRHGAYIRGNVITGNHCVIGHDTEVKNTILLDHAHAAHFAYLGDSILGNHVNLGAGTKCANLRLDNEQINVNFNGTKIKTGLRKFGAILGDFAQMGCNSVSNPGTLIGKGVLCYPCTNIGGFIAEKQIVKPDTKLRITKISE